MPPERPPSVAPTLSLCVGLPTTGDTSLRFSKRSPRQAYDEEVRSQDQRQVGTVDPSWVKKRRRSLRWAQGLSALFLVYLFGLIALVWAGVFDWAWGRWLTSPLFSIVGAAAFLALSTNRLKELVETLASGQIDQSAGTLSLPEKDNGAVSEPDIVTGRDLRQA